jgi:hypothetical protein
MKAHRRTKGFIAGPHNHLRFGIDLPNYFGAERGVEK